MFGFVCRRKGKEKYSPCTAKRAAAASSSSASTKSVRAGGLCDAGLAGDGGGGVARLCRCSLSYGILVDFSPSHSFVLPVLNHPFLLKTTLDRISNGDGTENRVGMQRLRSLPGDNRSWQEGAVLRHAFLTACVGASFFTVGYRHTGHR